MLSPTIYDDSASVLRLLLQGPAGSGKSCVLGQFPGVYVIDLDHNFKSAWDYLRSKGLHKNIVGTDFVDEDEQKKKVPLAGIGFSPQYKRLSELLVKAEADSTVQTIGIDSGTIMADILVAETLAKQGKPVMSKQEWGHFANYGKHLMAVLASARKNIVVTFHEVLPKDINGNIVYPYKVTWPGQIGDRIGMFFTNVWRCKCEATGFPAKHTWKIYTMPSSQFELKNTLVGLPAEFEFKWETIESKLKPTTTK